MNTPDTLAPRAQYLTLCIATETYGLALLSVREIIRREAVTKVPHVPSWIHGVINLRGSVIAVVDLALRFGLPACVPTPSTCVVVVEVAHAGEQVVVGLLADSVEDVIELGAAEIQPTPPFGTRAHTDFLRGVGMQTDRLVLLLETDRILHEADKETLVDVGARAAESADAAESDVPDEGRRRDDAPDLESTTERTPS